MSFFYADASVSGELAASVVAVGAEVASLWLICAETSVTRHSVADAAVATTGKVSCCSTLLNRTDWFVEEGGEDSVSAAVGHDDVERDPFDGRRRRPLPPPLPLPPPPLHGGGPAAPSEDVAEGVRRPTALCGRRGVPVEPPADEDEPGRSAPPPLSLRLSTLSSLSLSSFGCS